MTNEGHAAAALRDVVRRKIQQTVLPSEAKDLAEAVVNLEDRQTAAALEAKIAQLAARGPDLSAADLKALTAALAELNHSGLLLPEHPAV
jgi:hypothetical protein